MSLTLRLRGRPLWDRVSILSKERWCGDNTAAAALNLSRDVSGRCRAVAIRLSLDAILAESATQEPSHPVGRRGRMGRERESTRFKQRRRCKTNVHRDFPSQRATLENRVEHMDLITISPDRFCCVATLSAMMSFDTSDRISFPPPPPWL